MQPQMAPMQPQMAPMQPQMPPMQPPMQPQQMIVIPQTQQHPDTPSWTVTLLDKQMEFLNHPKHSEYLRSLEMQMELAKFVAINTVMNSEHPTGEVKALLGKSMANAMAASATAASATTIDAFLEMAS